MRSDIRSGRNVVRADFLLGAFVALALAGCSYSAKSPSQPSQTNARGVPVIAAGVSIGTVQVGGKTVTDAADSLKSAISRQYAKFKFQLVNPSGHAGYHYSLDDFQARFDIADAVGLAMKSSPGSSIPLPLKVDKDLVKLHISRIADNWRVPVQEPRVKFMGKTRIVFPGHAGQTVDQPTTLATVLSTLPSLTNPSVIDKVALVETQPVVDPARVLGLADTLVTYTTTFNPGNGTRTNNLLLAVRNINGTVVGPGEVFSYNDSVGPRTQDTGFQDAIIYVDNRMKKDVGGGICQASSTLYNCVLLANMTIVERHAHSLPVHYVPAGRDATVAWGGDDFRFMNNTSKPIIVRATATPGGTLTESLIGDRAALPHPDEQVAIDVTPQRPYEDGYAVNSYRVVKEDGVLIAKEPLGISVYHKLVGGVPH